MGGSLRFEAPTALQYFAALVAEDAGFSLLEAAVAVAHRPDEAHLQRPALRLRWGRSTLLSTR